MEQYLDAKVKRFVQKRLFSHIPKTKTILGLAGTHPEKYMEVLPYHKQVILNVWTNAGYYRVFEGK